MAKMILTNGFYAAENGSWNWITDTDDKFRGNKNITFWFADLPNLTNGNVMFQQCKNLASFSGDLHNLTNGYRMFQWCETLTSFSVDLSAVTNGNGMFNYCTNLTSFSSDLSSLTNGTQMFGSGTWDCTKLDLASVQNIANTINTVSSGTIHIGMQTAIQGNADLEAALAAIRAKGWTVNELYA